MGKQSRRNKPEYDPNQPVGEKQYSKIKKISPRNDHQKQYIEAIENNIITIGAGPAGSGKTFLAVYEALCHLFSNKATGIKRIVITRPAVEAGEKLGFLPGDLDDKMDPYMRPIYDALYDIVGVDLVKEKIERGYIEVAPLAYMRGRTFNNCFIILDEAQNATLEQLKMVLTRIGENCKLVIDGDPSQSDLPAYHKKPGLSRLETILPGILDIAIIKFNQEDIVRSRIISDIIKAFEGFEEGSNGHNGHSQ